jgi:4-hydroxy-4-methyl-2-oxoglutarate aldolase
VSPELSAEELEALRKINTPTLSNAIETFNVRPRNEGFMDSSIRCILPELGTMVGYACTATICASRQEPSPPPWEMWEAVLKVPAPRVVVIQDLDAPQPVGSFWGEVNGNTFKALGCAGTVTNSGVRDLDEVRQLGFHFFASCVLVSHAYVHLVDIGVPVNVGGITVNPDDLIHADQHGVLIVPPEIAREIPRAAAEVEERERRIIGFCQSPDFSPQGLRDLYAELAKQRKA